MSPIRGISVPRTGLYTKLKELGLHRQSASLLSQFARKHPDCTADGFALLVSLALREKAIRQARKKVA